MARLLDIELLKHKEFTSEIITNCIKTAEWEFTKVDFHTLENKLKKAGWSLEYIYLDSKKFRYTLESVETP